jgi:putative colanic acid biosysnthesis UDP-glucose lipid carrier transferase
MSSLVKLLFFLVDTCLLNVAILSGFYFNDPSFWSIQKTDVIYFIIFGNISWLFLVLVSTPYSLAKDWTVSKIVKNQLAFLLIHLLVIFSLVSFLNKRYEITQIALFYFFFTVLFFGYRIGFYYVRKFFVKPLDHKAYILIGRNALSSEIRKFYLVNPEMHYRFIGYIDFKGADFPLEEVQQICSKNDIHEIICCSPEVSKTSLQQLVQFGLDSLIKVKIMFSLGEGRSQSLELEQHDKLPGIDLSAIEIDDPRNQLLKRLFDLFFAFLFFVLILSWFIPLIAIIIKLDSRGPVFFIQQRNGERNAPFGCIKFRTMVVNNEADSRQATRNDTRITRVGKFLRKSSLDELPQFINVLLGDMSLIGPRPHPIKLNEQFLPLIGNIMSRHYVKPGITGLAQCMGYRGETSTLSDMENRVRLDRYYIENWTFWLDIKIIFLTIVSLIRGSDKAF